MLHVFNKFSINRHNCFVSNLKKNNSSIKSIGFFLKFTTKIFAVSSLFIFLNFPDLSRAEITFIQEETINDHQPLIEQPQLSKYAVIKQAPGNNVEHTTDPVIQNLREQLRINTEALKADGLILRFHQWPEPEEEDEILNFLNLAGLQKRTTNLNLKSWFFEWPDVLKPEKEAMSICQNLPQTPNLDYCEPNTTSSKINNLYLD